MRDSDRKERENKQGRRFTRHRIDRITCVCLAALLLLTGGYLGVNQFRPEERSIELGEYNEAAVRMNPDEDASAPGGASAWTDAGEGAGEREGVKDTNAVAAAGANNNTGIGADNNTGAAGDAGGLTVSAKSALLMDAGTGAVLYAFNENDRRPPASVTKIMTMLLVLEAVDAGKISLDDTVTISAKAASMGGSQMYMEEGEQHTMEEIMKGVAMVSANDGCVAAAEHLAGSVDIFVENMNRRATELGMENTNFVNTNGLPADNHYSSAYDIAIMSRELLKHMNGKEWFTTWQDTLTVGLPGKETEFGLTNTNKLIKQYPGAIGIKTGFTSDAGYCLSGAATREGTTLIAVVMGCETSNTRLKEISALLDYGFANYETVTVAEKGTELCPIEIEKGVPEESCAVSAEDISVLVKKGEKGSVTSEILIDESAEAPLKKGDKIGEVVVYKDGAEIGRYDAAAAEDIKKAGAFEIYVRILEKTLGE